MIILTGILTTVVGFVGLGLIADRWSQEPNDFLFGIGLFFSITAIFGLATAIDYRLDYILYPLRLLVMVWCIYALYKK